MPESGVLIQSAGEVIQEIGTADILVAIPTYNNADTIGPLLRAAQTAVLQFSAYKTVILQTDAGSGDSTVEQARGRRGQFPVGR